MSVVGPRPERPHFVKRFLEEIAHYDSRHRLKVGITGWAQVNGWRGDTSIQKRFEFDLYYLQNWSFWFDLRIILLTALATMLWIVVNLLLKLRYGGFRVAGVEKQQATCVMYVGKLRILSCDRIKKSFGLVVFFLSHQASGMMTRWRADPSLRS